MDGLRNTVIPFQVPSLGRVGYEQSVRKREEQRQEQRQREQESRQLTSGIYGSMMKIDPSFGGRRAIEDKLNTVIDLSQQYELGNEDVYDDLVKQTEEIKALINMGIGASTAVSQARNERAINPNDYATDFNQDYWSKQWTAEEMMSAEFQQGLVQALPQKNIPVNKYINPLELNIYDQYANSNQYLNIQQTQNRIDVSLQSNVKDLVKENLKTAMRLDNDLSLAVFLFSAARADENLQSGQLTQEDLQRIALKYQSSPELTEQAINDYSDMVYQRLENIAASKSRTYKESTATRNPPQVSETAAPLINVFNTQKPAIKSDTQHAYSIPMLGGLKYEDEQGNELQPSTLIINPKTGNIVSVEFTGQTGSGKKLNKIFYGVEAENLITSKFKKWKGFYSPYKEEKVEDKQEKEKINW